MRQFKESSFLRFFVQHRTAANIIMIMMILVGILSIGRLNKQFFPDFDVELVTISIDWPGATAEEIDQNIIQLLEPELRPISGVKKVLSRSVEGVGVTNVEFKYGQNIQKGRTDIETAVSRINFPDNSKKPKIVVGEFFDTVTRITLSGDVTIEELRENSKKLKEKLLKSGVDKVDIQGLPKEEILIEIPQSVTARLQLSFKQIAELIKLETKDVSGGSFADGSLRVRTVGEKKLVKTFENLELTNTIGGGRILLKDIANIKSTIEKSSVLKSINGKPAVELWVRRSKTSDALEVSENVQKVLSKSQEIIISSINIQTYNTAANLIQERISLLVKNGISGLFIVLAVLFVFLSRNTAIWVALGIPIAFLATFGVMLISGQSINMISLFGLIMALGIVVDDAIVVGEHTSYLKTKRHLDSSRAPVVAATRMSMPVISAMLTTVAAFLPLFMVKGVIGQIISAIPWVVCAVLVASLIECFLVLPAHLAHFDKSNKKEGKFRIWFDEKFKNFQEGAFRKFIYLTFNYRYVTFMIAIGMFIISVGMVSGGRVLFSFFPTPEADIIIANFKMHSGTTKSHTQKMLNNLEQALSKTASDLSNSSDLVKFHMSSLGSQTSFSNDSSPNSLGNDLLGSMVVELKTADKRNVRIKKFINTWRDNIEIISGLDKLTIRSPSGGPPGRDLDIRFQGNDLKTLKSASNELIQIARTIPGATSLDDNLEYGIQERIISLTPKGQSLGLSVADIGEQVRSAINGITISKFSKGDEEVTVRLKLSENEQLTDMINNLRIITPAGMNFKLRDIVNIDNQLPFASIYRQNGSREVTVSGDLFPALINTSQARQFVLDKGLLEIAKKYDLSYSFEGRDLEQKETFADMKIGSIIGLLSIYFILAWVFKSWFRPFSIMIMIPFSFIGAVLGHYILGLTMSILSMFALLALAGIVVNNSIILVSTIERRLEDLNENKNNEGFASNFQNEAIISGVVDRFRPVLLTSLTTVGGLSALMFEKSLQAQFLIPMAATIVFGLAITAFLVLVIVPSMMGISNDLSSLIKKIKGRIYESR
ncbi:MAG: efflux RND transporter permease subunit [Proteobacteria bacterium]|nr:efflux RND transporter permease subunit [Pseudomonadota bacterium]MDA1136358.1 efflux RND transporter permease subunit [Pseudomonadota bacterium]